MCVPVVAVEVVQPASLLHQLDGARVVPPGGVAVRAFVLLVLAALHAALVRLLGLVVHVVVHTLPGVGSPTAQPCSTHTHTEEMLSWCVTKRPPQSSTLIYLKHREEERSTNNELDRLLPATASSDQGRILFFQTHMQLVTCS